MSSLPGAITPTNHPEVPQQKIIQDVKILLLMFVMATFDYYTVNESSWWFESHFRVPL